MEDESRQQDLDSPSNIRFLTFSELVDELCPQYMAMGVSYHEFWHGDYTQLQFYHEAYRLRAEQENYNAFLLGNYIYDALCAVSPVLNANAKSGTKPMPYHKKPYGMDEDNSTSEKTPEELQKIHARNAAARFASFVAQWNKRFKSKGGEDNGGNDRPITDRDTGEE